MRGPKLPETENWQMYELKSASNGATLSCGQTGDLKEMIKRFNS